MLQVQYVPLLPPCVMDTLPPCVIDTRSVALSNIKGVGCMLSRSAPPSVFAGAYAFLLYAHQPWLQPPTSLLELYFSVKERCSANLQTKSSSSSCAIRSCVLYHWLLSVWGYHLFRNRSLHPFTCSGVRDLLLLRSCCACGRYPSDSLFHDDDGHKTATGYMLVAVFFRLCCCCWLLYHTAFTHDMRVS